MKGLAVAAAMALAGLAAPADAQGECDRACLAGKLDRFLDAVVENDPSAAGLWTGFRQTQNAELIAPGEGIWASNSGLGTLDSRYYDPQTGGAEFFGTIREGEKTAIASLRLKVEQGEVSEAEWHIARADDPGIFGKGTRPSFDLDLLLANPPATRIVPAAERAPRRDLIAAVNSYFDGITAQTGRHVQANPGCVRFENGMGAPEWTRHSVLPEDADFQDKADCRSGYAGLGIVNVAARRYLMVDEEAQVVVASTIFLREPLNPKRRANFMELFYMDGGKISAVYAAITYPDSKLPLPNWPPYDGNFAVPQDLVPHN